MKSKISTIEVTPVNNTVFFDSNVSDDIRTAQKSMEVECYADILGKLKPAFIHHPEATSPEGDTERLWLRPRENLF
jgi:hypothetical protein